MLRWCLHKKPVYIPWTLRPITICALTELPTTTLRTSNSFTKMRKLVNLTLVVLLAVIGQSYGVWQNMNTELAGKGPFKNDVTGGRTEGVRQIGD